ncbi:MAG: TIGR03905 family TSCPD domain-containing protein [Lachnospiraceae bacterium]|nr:TIGR03905 family TSCPD domain-containing protein [Lachnospiraceae bacterium]
MQYSYKTKGTCSQQINFKLEGDIVTDIQFVGGCNGNTKGVAALCEGLTVDEIETRLKGIQCGVKGTSCVDQLALAVREALTSVKA